MLIRISVKTLAEFVHRSGDLYPPLGGRVSGEEGLEMQRRAQRNRPESYATEVAVQDTIDVEDLSIALTGRVDGCDLSSSPALVEEIKTTRAAAAEAERLVGSAHWAQATIYAALLAREHREIKSWQVRLLYCHPDSGAEVPFDRAHTTDELAEYLVDTIDRYGAWMARQLAYRSNRDAWLAERAFPYGEFRRHQRALAGRVFQAFREGEHLLLEAPTGSGKTMGVLFPALKALSTGLVERLFFLTSRGTGAIAAVQACEDLEIGTRQIRVVDLIAKEKACPVPGMPCDDTCPYAVGYFDRIEGAVTDLLERAHMTNEVVRSVADEHSVCPFELSLDAALWADLVIGDYNYLLDPVVKLQRFAEDGGLGLLIDESHQLAERTRNMLSTTLERSQVRAALKEAPPALLTSRLKSVDRALLALRKTLSSEGDQVIEEPVSFLRAVQRAMEALADAQIELAAYPVTQRVMFDLSRWHRSSSWLDAENFRYFARVLDGGRGVRNLSVSLSCLDPADYLAETLAGYGPHVRFSGTVSPLALYQTQHGQTDAPAERVESIFESQQLATLIVNDLPVYYRQREQTLPRLARLVSEVVSSRSSNYLVAVPSFEYLDQLGGALAKYYPAIPTIRQSPGMDDEARATFLDTFAANGETMVGLIVLGGVFGESVDFSHAPLAGVVCVGVGLPPVSAFRDTLQTHFDERLESDGGETVAYQQPAMTKVLQMAGRLLRGPDDRGILCLVDDRFTRPAFQRFFPRHWRPEILPARAIAARLAEFWRGGSAQDDEFQGRDDFHPERRLPRLRPTTDEPPEIVS